MFSKFKNKPICTIILIVSFLLSGCGPSAEEIAAAETKIAADTFATQTAAAPTATPTPTVTKTPTPTLNKTATAAFRATSTAQPMADLIQQLYDDGYILSTQGEYSQLGVFQEDFAQINWVRPFPTRIRGLKNFVLRSDITWKTAKEGANIRLSGCGFWFGVDKEIENFHEILVALNGYVNFSRCLNNCSYLESLARSYFGKIDYMIGSAELILVVEGSTIQAFINREPVFVRYDQKKLTGDLYYAISSGTNADFGTRCTFRDTMIWSLEE